MADITITTGGFSATEVTFTAANARGRVALQELLGGGFACQAITVRKSYAGGYQELLERNGITVALGA